MKFTKIKSDTMHVLDSGHVVIIDTLIHFDKDLDNIKRMYKPTRNMYTEVDDKYIVSTLNKYGLTVTDGLGDNGYILLNSTLYYNNFKNQDSNGHYVRYTRNKDKYTIHDNIYKEEVELTEDNIIELTKDVVINGREYDNCIKKIYISKDDVKDIKSLFKYHMPSFKVDIDFINKLQLFILAWSQKDTAYIDFLGSGLLGVHSIKFSTNDEDMLFVDILNIDKNMLKSDIYELDGIEKNWKVTSNNVYLTLVYLMHLIVKSNLSDENKLKGLGYCYNIFAYKVLSSLITHYFPYQPDIATAKLVYEKLTNKHLLKRLGTWQALIDYRSEDIKPGGLHYHRLFTLSTDDATRVIVDLQGRLRDQIKIIYSVLVEVNKNNEKIYSSSIISQDEESGNSIKDVVNRQDNQIYYIKSIMHNANDFIIDDLVYLTTDVMKRISENDIIRALKYISNNADNKSVFIDKMFILNIQYLNTKNITTNYKNHIMECITYIKGYWSSGTVKNQDMTYVKDTLYDLISKSTTKKTEWVIKATVLAVVIYFFIRSLYRNKH